MKKNQLLLLLAIVASTAYTKPRRKKEKPVEPPAQEQVAAPTVPKSELKTVQVGKTVTISIEANPTTGYRWSTQKPYQDKEIGSHMTCQKTCDCKTPFRLVKGTYGPYTYCPLCQPLKTGGGHPASIIKLENQTYMPSDPKLLGSGGHEQFTFKGLHQGLACIHFQYKREWEPAPVQVKEFFIQVIR